MSDGHGMLHFDKTCKTVARNARSSMLFLLTLLLAQGMHDPQVATALDNPLVGLWGTEQSFGPLVRGTLTIDGRQPQWRAATAGFDVSVKRNGDLLSFSLPNSAGEFRGRLNPKSNSINGQWIQPVGV